MSARRNEVAVIAGRDATVLQLAPSTISFLQVPLTPARAAHLAAFCARTGVDPQSLVLDLIDDVIFNEAPTVS